MKRIDIDTDRLRTSCWVCGPENGTPVLLIHGAEAMREVMGVGQRS
jgi:hypothetical protein